MSERLSIADSNGKRWQLERCPFCGSDDLWIDEPMAAEIVSPADPPERDVIQGCIACYDCGAGGPFKNTTAEAVSAWNDRS